MARTYFTKRAPIRGAGASHPPFDSYNLAMHVGDDPLAVATNRSALAAEIGLNANRIYYMNQVHGPEVAVLGSADTNDQVRQVDALYTREQGIALVVLVADCIPLLLASEEAIAAVHVGRKGLAAGIVERVLAQFASDAGVGLEVRAEIGASICVDCYQVDIKNYEEVTAKYPAAATDRSRRQLDLTKAVTTLLSERGISVEVESECTRHGSDYFSYRRDGKTGRQAGVIWR